MLTTIRLHLQAKMPSHIITCAIRSFLLSRDIKAMFSAKQLYQMWPCPVCFLNGHQDILFLVKGKGNCVSTVLALA